MADEADRAQAQIEEWERLQEQARLARMANELQSLCVTECQECGDDIGEARKAAVPTTTLCIDCADIKERRRS